MNVLNKLFLCFILILTMTYTGNSQDHTGDFVVSGNITAKNTYNFSNGARLTRFGQSAINFVSNHQSLAGARFISNDGDFFGSIAGRNGSFGLADTNGSYFIANNNSEGVTNIRTNNQLVMSLFQDGKVRIGDLDSTPGDYKLFVEDGILSERVRVAVDGAADWADYVFEDNYDLMPLSDVKTFIEDNDHLPNVPSAEQMVESGLDVLESDAILLRKIEEAYLYILQQQEQLDELKKEIANLRN